MNNVVKNILGGNRRCKNCGKVHKHEPFTDCYSEADDGPIEGSHEEYYKQKFGDY